MNWLALIMALPLLVIAVLLMVLPWIWPVVKTWLASHKLFYAALRERSALGRRRVRNTWLIYIKPGPEDKEQVADLKKTYDKMGQDAPVKIEIVTSKDGLVWIGWPFWNYESVTPWSYTADLRDAANDEFHTIPLKQQTTTFPPALPDDLKQQLLERVGQAKSGKFRLRADEVRKLMAMNPQNSAEGYEIRFSLDADWEIISPVGFIFGHEEIGDLMVSVFNDAARLGMSGLRAVPVDKELVTATVETLSREFERRTLMYLDLITWDDEYANKKGMIRLPEKDRAKNKLLTKGVQLNGVRISDLIYPDEVIVLFKLAAEAHAKASVDLTAANVRVEAADRDAEALRNKGKGEKDYTVTIATGQMQAAKLTAEGDVARIDAWARDPIAVAARLQQIQAEAFRDAVTKPGDGKVIITGVPGTSAPSIESLVASAAAVARSISSDKAVTTTSTERSTKTSKKDKKSGNTPITPTTSDEGDDDEGEE